MILEINDEESIGDMSRKGYDISDEKFETRGSEFFGYSLKDTRDPRSDGRKGK